MWFEYQLPSSWSLLQLYYYFFKKKSSSSIFSLFFVFSIHFPFQFCLFHLFIRSSLEHFSDKKISRCLENILFWKVCILPGWLLPLDNRTPYQFLLQTTLTQFNSVIRNFSLAFFYSFFRLISQSPIIAHL